MNEQVYHERQSKQLCALHVLNNLFQVIFFVKEPFLLDGRRREIDIPGYFPIFLKIT